MFRIAWLSFFCLSFLAPSQAPAMCTPSAHPTVKAEAIGVRTLHYYDKTRGRPVLVELWYPSEATDAALDVPVDQVWQHPKEVRGAPVFSQDAKYPLILMSHGHRGDRRERSWLADLLVRHGFIVAAVEHHGNVWMQYSPVASLRFWDRAKDISFALNCLLDDSLCKNFLDPQRIGFVGYSLGGMTGLALAGAQVKNTKELVEQKQGSFNELAPEIIEQVDFEEGDKNYREPRIRSMMLICPATFVYSSEALRAIKIPIGLIASVDDEILPYKEHAYRLIRNIPLHKVKLLRKKISHYAFLNHMTEYGRKLFQKKVESASEWTTTHKETGAFALKFFRETL